VCVHRPARRTPKVLNGLIYTNVENRNWILEFCGLDPFIFTISRYIRQTRYRFFLGGRFSS
jgi:hypothetical protein